MSFGPRLDAPESPFGFTRLTPSKPTIARHLRLGAGRRFRARAWCDLRIATPSWTLGYPERRWGVPLIDGGTQRLPRIVGWAARWT